MVAWTTLPSSCVLSSGYHYSSSCPADMSSTCGPGPLVAAAIGAGVVAVAAGAYFAVSQHRRPVAGGAAPLPRPLVGQVRWRGSNRGVSAVPVSLRRADGHVVPTTLTDREGWFQFPFPPKPGWYTVSADGDAAKGETTVWLQDQRPATLEVLVAGPPDSSR
jgi:hypothetical protein